MEMAPWDFYDMKILIYSMNSLLKDGWEILWAKEESQKIYEKYKDIPSVLISVFGNLNTGKSFILRKISGIGFPCGYSIYTQGLSIKYLTIQRQYLIFLNSRGFNLPLLFINKDRYNLSEKEYIEKINTFTSDRLLTEYFILNFILYYSNIPILVLDELSFSQQELYDKTKKLLYGNQLFVIHNLKNFEESEEVYNYIKDVLLLSTSFNLKDYEMINFLNINKDQKIKNYIYYLEEINNENGKKNIIHLFMAKEGTEAGDYYNETTIHFLRQILNYCNRQKFPIVERLKEFLFKISNNIMEKPIDNINQISIENEWIRLTYEKDKKLKFKFYNEIIFSEQLMGNKYIPKYYYYKSQDGRFLFIELIICGDIISLKNKIDLLNNFYYFHYEGEKSITIENPKESEIIGFSKKKERFFNFDIKIPITEIFLKEYKIYSKKFEYGILTLSYELFNREKNDNEIDIKF